MFLLLCRGENEREAASGSVPLGSSLVWPGTHGLVAMAAAGLMGSLCKFCDRRGGPGTRGLIGGLDKVGATSLRILVRGRGEGRGEK